MAAPLVSDALWSLFAALLPPRPPRPKGGRPPIEDRAALTGILFVLKSGIPWEMLPQEMGSGCGMTCWRRLRDWQEAGIWQAFHHALLDRLGRAGLIDWSRCSLDAASLPAKAGGAATGRNPTDRGKPGSKHHVVVDRQGIPLAVLLTAATCTTAPCWSSARPGAADPPAAWPPATPPDEAARRQGVRLPPLPPSLPKAGHHPAHRPAGDREQPAARPTPLGGRAHPVVDRSVPPADDPLRAPRRHPSRFPHACLRRDLLSIPPEVLLGSSNSLFVGLTR